MEFGFKKAEIVSNSKISNLKLHIQSVFSISSSSKDRVFHCITDQGTPTEEFPVPWGDSDSEVYVSNSCNGMLLICVGTCFYLFNPSTHYYVKVLTDDFMYDENWRVNKRGYNMLIGLYYDEAISDYKAVVLIHYRLRFTTTASILVEASLKEKRWNHRNHTFKCYDVVTVGPMVNRRIHWLNDNKIFRFDPVLKVFEELPSFQPPPNHTKYSRISGIGILEGCLCVSRIVNKNSVEMLAMKEYGVSESWTPIFSFSNTEFSYINMYHCVDPLLLTKTGELYISMGKKNMGVQSWQKII